MLKIYFTKSIVKGIKNRDSKIFEYLDKKFRKKVINHVRKNSSNNPDIDGNGLYNESILEVIRVIDEGRYNDKISFGAFFYRVYQRKWLKTLNPIPTLLNTDFLENSIADNTSFEELKLFYSYFSRLSDVCRDILNFFIRGFDQKEIAVKLNMTHDAVRKQKGRCIEIIRKWIEEDRGYDGRVLDGQ